MDFSKIVGNEDVTRALTGMVDSGRVPHAIMFYENDGCGAMAIALAFMDLLYKHDQKVSKIIHPDIHFTFPVAGTNISSQYLPQWRELLINNPYFLEDQLSTALGSESKSSSINVGDADEILKKLSLHSLEGGYKTVVIYLPEKMNASAANRLLKVVEEPPEMTVFLMITHSPDNVISTISSRCQGIRIFPQSKEEIVKVLENDFAKNTQDAIQAASMAGGSVGKALEFLSDEGEYDSWMNLFEDLINYLINRDLSAAQDCAETLQGMDSREKQKAFCKFAIDLLRKIFLIQQGLESLAQVREDRREFFYNAAGKLKKSFVRNAMGVMDKTVLYLGRNVNQKILFCDMVNRLYVLV